MPFIVVVFIVCFVAWPLIPFLVVTAWPLICLAAFFVVAVIVVFAAMVAFDAAARFLSGKNSKAKPSGVSVRRSDSNAV